MICIIVVILNETLVILKEMIVLLVEIVVILNKTVVLLNETLVILFEMIVAIQNNKSNHVRLSGKSSQPVINDMHSSYLLQIEKG